MIGSDGSSIIGRVITGGMGGFWHNKSVWWGVRGIRVGIKYRKVRGKAGGLRGGSVGSRWAD